MPKDKLGNIILIFFPSDLLNSVSRNQVEGGITDSKNTPLIVIQGLAYYLLLECKCR